MKRWRDRNALEPDAERDLPAQGPLEVERLASRGRRMRYAIPIAIGLVALVTGLAFVGKYIVAMQDLARAPSTPAVPTPIAWLDTTARPTASPASPAASPSQATVLTIRTEAASSELHWTRKQPNHFTITLTNTTGAPFSLDPCPTYRMYILNPGAPEGPTRVLNCAAIGAVLEPGQSVTLDMIFTPTDDDPGGYQMISWKLVSPPGYQALAVLKYVFILN